ncbi:MAG: hypothetical protein NVSMB65_15390 [Chloroflexota bacterium]
MSTPAPRGETVRLLSTLDQLLSLNASTVKETLQESTDLLTEALRADKVDAFVLDADGAALVTLGTSRTPMGRRQHQLGLHHLPLSGGGSTVRIFTTQMPYHTGHADQDPEELRGITEGLGVRSEIGTPLMVAGQRGGVLQACSAHPDWFAPPEVAFLTVVASWLGLVSQRAALGEEPTAATHGEVPTWKRDLLAWRLRRMDADYRQMEDVLDTLAAGFADAREELCQLQAALQAREATINSLGAALAQEQAAVDDAARVRRGLEERLHQAEAALERLGNEARREGHQ